MLERRVQTIAVTCFIAVLSIAFSHTVSAGHGEETKLISTSESGLAIRGYDTVAYFADGKPTVGSEALEYLWQGAAWRFKSRKHRAMFIANPTKYAPQYGAFCALGVSFHKAVPVDPNAWTIVEGKLYLNYSVEFREKWRADKAQNIKKADSIWSEHSPSK